MTPIAAAATPNTIAWPTAVTTAAVRQPGRQAQPGQGQRSQSSAGERPNKRLLTRSPRRIALTHTHTQAQGCIQAYSE